MECGGLQNNIAEWDCVMPEKFSQQADEVHQKLQNIVKLSLGNFMHQYNSRDKIEWRFAVEWSAGAPYTQEQIDRTREAVQQAKEEAHEHMKNSWEALGNYHGGSVIKESLEGLKALRESERLDREACHMENSNIEYDNERR